MSTLRFSTFMLSCEDRADVRSSTLASLRESGWQGEPEVVVDDGEGVSRLDRIHRTWRRVLQRAAAAAADFVLLLEDDVRFGRWFAENLSEWRPLREVQPGGAFYASLYNPERPFIRRSERDRYLIAYPDSVWGAQALVMTPRTARFIDANWELAPGNPDQRMPRLASRVTPIYLHFPSLVDHSPVPTTWGGIEHRALDFNPDYRARAAEVS
jgi:hypothetical protein